MLYRHISNVVKRSLPILLLLSKSDLALCTVNLVDGGQKNILPTEKIGTEIQKSTTKPLEAANMSEKNGKNGLLLYYNEYSFYSQKVVLALYEKNLKFETHSIELNGEQYKPWFLQINPKGEVPVLQDTGKIIPDSARIIDYLEDNFSNGDTPRLLPIDQGEVRQRVTQFRNLIDKINGNVLTVGSFLHPELATGSKKVPFIGPVRTSLLNADRDSAANLRKYAAENPEAKEMLLEKAVNQEKKREKLLNKEEFLKIVKETDDVLDKVEAELAEHQDADKKNWWLCTDRFTVADVSLTILLVRLNQIGMEPHFWAGGKRPNLENYFSRVQQRESYKKTIPTTCSLIATIVKTQLPLFIGVSIATVVSLVIGGWFLVRRWINKNN